MPKDLTKPNKITELIKGDNWSPEQLQAMMLLAEPKRDTEEEIAKKVGVRRETVWVWKKLPYFMENVIAIADELFLEWDLQVCRAILKEAIAGNVKAQALWLKYRGKLVEKLEHTGAQGGEIVVRWAGDKCEKS